MNGWVRVTRNNPCPVCGKYDNCCVTEDGGAAWCGRVSSETVNNGGQSLHILKERERPEQLAPRLAQKPVYFTKEAQKLSKSAEAADLERLAKQLLHGTPHSPARMFKGISVGYDSDKRYWTIPERDDLGNVIGICRRYEDGSKFMIEGGKRGLIYQKDWYCQLGPVYCPEGFTDVAALQNCGFCTIGRPSCSGGIEMLGNLLLRAPSGKRIIILGENDRKTHESLSEKVKETHDPDCPDCMQCWPGKWGARRTASALAKKLGIPVSWTMPPDDCKDAREWVVRHPEWFVDTPNLNWEIP